jgi:hypothetical protein
MVRIPAAYLYYQREFGKFKIILASTGLESRRDFIRGCMALASHSQWQRQLTALKHNWLRMMKQEGKQTYAICVHVLLALNTRNILIQRSTGKFRNLPRPIIFLIKRQFKKFHYNIAVSLLNLKGRVCCSVSGVLNKFGR